MSLYLMVDGIMYQRTTDPTVAWEPVNPQDLALIRSEPDEPPAPHSPRELATPLPPGQVDLFLAQSAGFPKAPPTGNSEIVSVPAFRPRVHVPRLPTTTPDVDRVEPIDPDTFGRRYREPDRPVLITEVMSQPVDCLDRSATVAEARTALENGHYHHAPVVDEHHRLIGILSDRDLLAANPSAPVDTVMSSPVLVASDSTPLYLACEALWTRRFSCLPVVDGNFRPIGILTVHDVLRHLVKHPSTPLWNLG